MTRKTVGTVVYAHYRADDGDLFYIGIGKGDRPWRKKGRNDWWKRVVAKHGLRVEIVFDGLTDDEAKKWEIDLISMFDHPGLTNITRGGDGCSYFGEKGEILKRRIGARMAVTVTTDKWKDNHRAAMKAKFKDPVIAAEHREQMKRVLSSPEWKTAMMEGCAKRGESWRENVSRSQRTPEARALKAAINRTPKMACSYADRWKRPYTSLVGYGWLA